MELETMKMKVEEKERALILREKMLKEREAAAIK